MIENVAHSAAPGEAATLKRGHCRYDMRKAVTRWRCYNYSGRRLSAFIVPKKKQRKVVVIWSVVWVAANGNMYVVPFDIFTAWGRHIESFVGLFDTFGHVSHVGAARLLQCLWFIGTMVGS